MEILFRNKRNTAKLCMKVSCNNINCLKDSEINKLEKILSMNEGYTWQPVRDGFAYDNKLLLIEA